MERRVPEAPLTRAEKCIEERAGTFRARCKKSGRTYRGPTRTLRAEALEDAHKLVAAADTSSQELEAIVAQLHSKLPQAKLTKAEQCIEERGGTFRVRFKKGGRTHIGPTRTSKDEALEDAKSLVAAADISMAELQAAEARLRPQTGTQEVNLEKAVLEAMSYWLEQSDTSSVQGASSALKTRVRRLVAGSSQAQIFDAAKQLVKEHLEIESFSLDTSARWLRDLGLHWRLDYGSRPRGTAGFVDQFWQTGLRNLGNSCFLNAVVQCIFACQPLRRDLTVTVAKGPLRACMEDVVQRLQSEEWDYIAPYSLLHQMYKDWTTPLKRLRGLREGLPQEERESFAWQGDVSMTS